VLAAGVTLCVAGGSAAVVGFAAGFGGLSSDSLGSWSEALAAEAPAVITCDNFAGPAAPLDGRAVESFARCGALTWTEHVGAWAVVAGSAQSDGTADAVATLPAGATAATVAATVWGVDSGSNRGGVVVDHDGTNTFLAAVVVGDAPVHVDVLLTDHGVPVTLASADVAIGASTTMALTRSGSSVIVVVDGVRVLDETLDAAAIALLGAGDRAGLYASSASIQFDNLRVTTPSPG
jgi:hypothetical protein